MLCEEFIEGIRGDLRRAGGADATPLPVIRIAAPDGNYDYEHKYFRRHRLLVLPERPARDAEEPRSSASWWRLTERWAAAAGAAPT